MRLFYVENKSIQLIQEIYLSKIDLGIIGANDEMV
jgi:hypothetical protein